MKTNNQYLDEVQEKTEKTEKKLKTKQRERAGKKSEPASVTERLIAPALLLITILISYLILLFR